MITESYYWKKPLLSGARLIKKYMALEEMTEEQFARVERELFIGFYSIRKLIEATGKVSDKTRNLHFDVKFYPKRTDQPRVDWYNRNDFGELYDLECERAEQRDILYVAHRMVHSFVFALTMDNAGGGIFFASDRDKEKRINYISVNEVTRAFNAVGNDYPSVLRAWRDKQTGEMRLSVTE